MSTRSPTDRVAAYHNWGRWVVECPCFNAWQMAVGTPLVSCELCERRLAVVWPEEWREIEQLLAGRESANRNWRPEETLADLAAENLEHGVA